eukprot:TRINITY_DN50647_c0_g1_i1.p1 TRINITY_DN50647_c0_g1~~TRINITY_DN50647_c0_g1_i1.p1  ORF type:complete len:133 (+),score=39.06 TRINITY_DN50647_c0_g1_i1:132-530(+)
MCIRDSHNTVLGGNASLRPRSRGDAVRHVCFRRSMEDMAISRIACVLEQHGSKSILQLHAEKSGSCALMDLQMVQNDDAAKETPSHGYELLRFSDDGRVANLCSVAGKLEDGSEAMMLAMQFKVLPLSLIHI